MNLYLIALSVPLGAVLYALRGGAWVGLGSTTGARLLFWVIPTTAFLWWALGHPLGVWPLVWLALTAAFLWLTLSAGHGAVQDDGTMPQPEALEPLIHWLTWLHYEMTDPVWQRQLKDAVGMALIGVVRQSSFLAACPLTHHLLWMVPLGVLQGAAYWCGGALQRRLPWRHSWAELVCGATIWLELSVLAQLPVQ